MAATSYRYLTTSLLSGKVQGDWLPVTAMNFSRLLSSAGTFMGSLNLISGSAIATTPAARLAAARNQANLNAVTPRKSVLWIAQDGAWVWNGVIWDWNHMSILDGTLPLSAATLESVLAHRLITDTLTFTDADIFDIFRALIAYAAGKTPNGQIAGLTYSPARAGITDTLTFDGTQNQPVSDAVNTLAAAYGFEYGFRPYQDPGPGGGFHTSVDVGFRLGRSLNDSGLSYVFPGNLLDYRFTATGSSSANTVHATATAPAGAATATAGGALTGMASDATDLAAGFPLMEVAVSATGPGFTSGDQVAAYAEGYLPSVTDTQLTPMLTLGAGQHPGAAQISLGDFAQFTATSPLHPAGADGAPGFQGLGRVTGWTVYPPSASQAEYSWIQLGGMSLTP
jgi:hypothetical protein